MSVECAESLLLSCAWCCEGACATRLGLHGAECEDLALLGNGVWLAVGCSGDYKVLGVRAYFAELRSRAKGAVSQQRAQLLWA